MEISIEISIEIKSLRTCSMSADFLKKLYGILIISINRRCLKQYFFCRRSGCAVGLYLVSDLLSLQPTVEIMTLF